MIFVFIFLSIFFGINLIGKYWYIYLTLSLLIVIISFIKLRKRGGIIVIATISLSVLYCVISNFTYHNSYILTNLQGIVINSKENYFLFLSKGVRYYVYEKENKREQGDILEISGEVKDLDFYNIESQFNFEEYLNNKGIYKQIKQKKIIAKFEVPIRKKEIINSFLNKFSSKVKGLIKGIVFADIDYSLDIINDLSLLNLTSAFVTSGLLVYALLGLIKKILGRFIKKDSMVNFVAILIISPYIFFTFTKISVLRIFLLEIVKLLSLKIKPLKKYGHLSMLSLVGITLLILNPLFAFQSSFYMGFLVSFILYFSLRWIKVKGKIKQKLLSIGIIYITLLPMLVQSHNEFNFLGIIYHYLFLGINFTIMLFGLLSFVIPIFQVVTQGYTSFIISIYEKINIFKLTLPINLTSPIIIFLYYIFILLIIYGLELRLRKFKRFSISSLLIIFLLSIVPYESFITSSIHFINIGQGDACLIRDGNKNYMIDVGGIASDDLAQKSLIPFFNKQKIYQIDAVFISHYDYDHYGSLNSLINNFSVKNVYDYQNTYPIKIGNINFVNLNSGGYDNINDNSVVLYFNFIGYKFLFTGDISDKVEEDIINRYPNLDVDILKVAHHGSISSYNEHFIKTITPKEAIISVGKNNYGHPDDKIIALLKKYKVNIKITRELGTISYTKLTFNV